MDAKKKQTCMIHVHKKKQSTRSQRRRLVTHTEIKTAVDCLPLTATLEQLSLNKQKRATCETHTRWSLQNRVLNYFYSFFFVIIAAEYSRNKDFAYNICFSSVFLVTLYVVIFQFFFVIEYRSPNTSNTVMKDYFSLPPRECYIASQIESLSGLLWNETTGEYNGIGATSQLLNLSSKFCL